MVIILMSFFLPPDSGERIAVVITVLLALCLFLQFINTSLPKNADATPVLSIYYTAILVECTCSLVTTCIVLVMHHKGTEPWASPVPSWVQKLFFKNFPMSRQSSKETKTKEKFCTGGGDMKHQNITNDGNGEMEHMLSHPPYPKINPTARVPKEFKESKISDHISDYLLCGILKELRILTAEAKDRKEAEQNEAEWRYLSSCLDWLFFIMFVCLFAVTSVFILVPAYMEHTKYDH